MRWVDDRKVIERDANGQITHYQGIILDITERKRAEETLWLTQFSIAWAPQSIFWLNEHAQVLNVNDGACRQLGYSREALLQMTIFDFDPVFPKAAFPTLWQKLRQQRAMTIESVCQAQDGRRFPIEIHLSFVEYERIEYMFAFASDITERKQAEEALAASLAETENQSYRMSLLNDMSRDLSQTKSRDDVFDIIKNHLDKIIATDHTSICLLTSPDGQCQTALYRTKNKLLKNMV